MSGAALFSCMILFVSPGCTSVKERETAWPRQEPGTIPDMHIPAPYGLVGPLTLQTAIERAMIANPEIQSQRTAVEVAGKAVGAAGDWQDPQLRFSYGEAESDSLTASSRMENFSYSTSDSTGRPVSSSGETDESYQDSDGYRVTLRLYPPNPWERAAAVSAARADFYAAQASLQYFRAQTAYEVRRAYAEFLFAREDVEILSRLLTVSESLVKKTNELLERGQATVIESMDASRRYLSALADKDERSRDMDDAKGLLASLTGLPTDLLDIRHENVTMGDIDPGQADIRILEDTAMRYRGDLVAAGWSVRSAEAAYDAAKAARIPWLSHIQAAYGSSEDVTESWSTEQEISSDGTASSTQVSEREETGEEWRVDAAIRLPIFTWLGDTDNLRKAELQHAEMLELQGIMTMKKEIRSGLERLKRLEDQRARFNMAADPVTAEIWKVLDDNSSSNRNLPPADVARMKEQLIEISRTKLEAEFERTLTMLDIEAALGITAIPAAAGR